MTAKRRATLDARIKQRNDQYPDAIDMAAFQHIRAELDRLARQVRKLPTPSMDDDYALLVRERDVLALITAAKR